MAHPIGTPAGTSLTSQAPGDPHDSSVQFEEYLYYASLTRTFEAQQSEANITTRRLSAFWRRFGPMHDKNSQPKAENSAEKSAEPKPDPKISPSSTLSSQSLVSDEDWYHIARARRAATWGTVFYLITTDILGPWSVPWAMSKMGYGPGVVLYTVFGAFAGYSGYQLWRMFLNLDSYKYPVKNFGDLVFRIYGRWARHCSNVLQSIQLLFNVGIVILGNAQSLSQVTRGSLCFVICCVVWAAAGSLLGQIRSLKKFSWVAHSCIWVNLIIAFLVMGVAANSPPNFEAALANNGVPEGPVVTHAGSPPEVGFQAELVGLMQSVYAYGGAMIFCEFMSEMKRPWDFWKGMICAQGLIYCCYLLFGLFTYSYQGQFTINPVYQGLSPYAWQSVGNVLAIVQCVIYGALCSNIAIKLLWQTFVQEGFKGPDIDSHVGQILWIFLIPLYWFLAFVIATAVPQFSNISSLIAALCIQQFTYTFPPILMLGFEIKKDAMQEGEGFDPVTRTVTRRDSGWRRWRRGIAKQSPVKLFNLIFALGAAATAILGFYSSLRAIIESFEGAHVATSFGCASPVILNTTRTHRF
ncbi:amino acid transporter-like protein [Xylona heveae TC161]|uniref:Amino acid transporter-like protein n=1 Tax=Xylona heveae (strain CBS 132557 / TC161) TaxID=1328760 RepID=A0A165IKH2_XYLHT|nr:amino acid transporter-like protein [Xylona heveae TC161]KZF25025.1 amino acid transporter-like protein [Xylona heveae TC161]